MTENVSLQARQRSMRDSGLIGTLTNLVLTAGKIIFGYLAQSQALIADGMHSLANFCTDVTVWLTARKGNRFVVSDKQRNTARISAIVTLILGALFLTLPVAITWDAVQRLLNPGTLLQPSPIVLLVALFSIIANEGLYLYSMRQARKHNCALLKANAWYHRSCSLSSLVVLLGVSGTLLGLPYLDAFATTVIAFMVARIGWDLFWNSVRQLIEKELSAEQVNAVKKLIGNIDGVVSVAALRTRSMSGNLVFDLYIQVNDELSVYQGQLITRQVRNMLLHSNKNLLDVGIHIEAQSGAAVRESQLPNRLDVLEQLRKLWQDELEYLDLEKMVLHYLNGKIHIEIFFCNGYPPQDIVERLLQKTQQLDYIGRVSWYCPASEKKRAEQQCGGCKPMLIV